MAHRNARLNVRGRALLVNGSSAKADPSPTSPRSSGSRGSARIAGSIASATKVSLGCTTDQHVRISRQPGPRPSSRRAC